jgi:hypothetical protein
MEKRRLAEKDQTYLVFVAKVTAGKGFIDSTVGHMIFLRFDDIFDMLNLNPLH